MVKSSCEMKTCRFLVPVLAGALCFVACGSGGDAVLTRGVPSSGPPGTVPTVTTAVVQGPPPAAPSRPVCDLLAAGDVSAVLGNPVRPGTGDPKFCFWGTLVDRGSSADVTVGIPAAGRGAQACAVQEASLPKEASQEEVGGVGSNALWAWQQVAILVQGKLVACWGDAVVTVQVTGEKDQGVLRQNAVALAQSVHGRL
jgi:hypothetical protein